MMPDSGGELLAIWIKRAHRGVMDPVDAADLIPGRGLVGNADQGRRRQVTLIEQETWDRLMDELAADVHPSRRRANLMLRGIRLEGTRGMLLRVGECLLRISGETKPCERMDEAFPGLKRAMYEHWGGGAFAEVLEGGTIHTGDTAEWETS